MSGSGKAVAPGVRVEAKETKLPLAFGWLRHIFSIVCWVVNSARR